MPPSTPSCHSLAASTSPEVEALVARGALLAVPLGSTEQHGPHLTLGTDTDIARALCEGLARRTPEPVVVAPAVAITASGEHAGFAGTLSIGCEVLEQLLVELGRSATETFARVLFVNAHGGNVVPLENAVATLRYEGRDVTWFAPPWRGDAHAGHVETSVQLALDDARVRSGEVRRGDVRPLATLMPQLARNGLAAVAPTGVLGDPTTATSQDGADLLEAALAALVEHVHLWSRGDQS